MSQANHDHSPGHDHDAEPALSTAAHRTVRSRRDPTETKTLRQQYGSQFYKRFRLLKGIVWRAFAEEDVFDLSDAEPSMIPEDTRRGFMQDEPFPDPEPPPEQVELPTGIDPSPGVAPTADPRAVGPDIRDYIEWYREAQNEVVVGPGEWSDQYIRYAYEKGAEDANRRLSAAGVEAADDVALSLDMPIHRRVLGAVLERNREGIEGVTDATRRAVGEELISAVIEGRNPRDAARSINDRIDAIGITRARTHARTSIVGGYNEASLTRYEQLMGSDASVTILAEFATAGDSRVCPICQDREGQVLSVREAKGLIPLHPNCRCTWLPVTPDQTGSPALGS